MIGMDRLGDLAFHFEAGEERFEHAFAGRPQPLAHRERGSQRRYRRMRQQAEDTIRGRRELGVIPVHRVAAGGVEKRRRAGGRAKHLRAEDGGLSAAVGAPDVIAQNGAAVGRRSGEHDAQPVDDAAPGKFGGVGRHIPPARAGDEVDAGSSRADGLSHVRVKYPVVREEHNMSEPRELSRRAFLTAATVGSLTVFSRAQAPDFKFAQYHNQLEDTPLHRRLTEMWEAVRKESGGRVDTHVYAYNNKNPGSDPAVLKLLVAGEVQFFTLMGGILANVVPAANIQQVPFAFRTAEQAHKTVDGPLGTYLRGEMAAKGIVGFPVGAFDNGMRQIAGRTRPIRTPADLAGMRMRVPDGQMFDDMARALGAEPVTVNSADIYTALQKGTVDAQENPLAYMDFFKHYEVMKYLQHDEPHVVGLQHAGEQGRMGPPARRHPREHRTEPHPRRAPAARGTAESECRRPHFACRPRPRVQRGRSGALPRQDDWRLRELEKDAGDQSLVIARGANRPSGLIRTPPDFRRRSDAPGSERSSAAGKLATAALRLFLA